MPNCPKCRNLLPYEPTAYQACQYCAFPNAISSVPYYPPPQVVYPQYSYYVPPPYLQPQPFYRTPDTGYHGVYPPQHAPTQIPRPSRISKCEKCGGTGIIGTTHVCFPDLPSPLRLNYGEINSLIAEHGTYIRQYRGSDYPPIQKRVKKSERKIRELEAELTLRNKIKTVAMEKKKDFGSFPLPTDFDIAGARYLAYVIQLLAGQVELPAGMPEPPRVRMMDSLTLAVGSCADAPGLHYALSGEHEGQKIDVIQPEIQSFCGSVYLKFYAINAAYHYEQSIGRASSYAPNTYQIRVCAEPKLWNGLERKEKQRYNGMTTLWAGSKKNPYPLIPEETGVGSPMLPCPRCLQFSERL